jgi:hypothetical protein
MTKPPHYVRRNTVKRSSMLLSFMVVCCSLALILTPLAFGLGGWGDPSGGWDWLNDDFADLAEWNHDNGSDAWDGSAPGEAGTAPGGVKAETVDGVTVLSLEDTGDPRGDGFDDPSNRKIYLQREAVFEGNIFEGGVTFTARFRINPNPVEAPADGYTLHDDGKGIVGIVHDGEFAGDGTVLNLSFALDTGGLLYFAHDDQPPLEVGDEFQFHSIWATAKLAGDVVSLNVYVDGGVTPIFSGDIALDDGAEGNFANCVVVGMGSTGRDGAAQIDYVGYKLGVYEPTLAAAVTPSDKLPSAWGKLKLK